MPIYEFECQKCKTEFEFFKIRSDEVPECPTCASKGEEFLKRLVSKDTSHSLKGGGWFKDGYGSSRKKGK